MRLVLLASLVKENNLLVGARRVIKAKRAAVLRKFGVRIAFVKNVRGQAEKTRQRRVRIKPVCRPQSVDAASGKIDVAADFLRSVA